MPGSFTFHTQVPKCSSGFPARALSLKTHLVFKLQPSSPHGTSELTHHFATLSRPGSLPQLD